MKILLTCDRYPFPLSEGLVLRVYHYVRSLAGRHQFDLACLAADSATRDAGVEALFEQVFTLAHRRNTDTSPWARLLDRLRPRIDGLYPNDPAIRGWLQGIVDAGHYDLIWDAGCNMLFNVVPLKGRPPVLADQVDDAFLSLERRLPMAQGFVERARLGRYLRLQRIFARRFLLPIEPVLFVSDLDAARFGQAFPHARVAVINNGVDVDHFAPGVVPAAAGAAAHELVFEGVMAFDPNIDAAQYFVQSVLPGIVAQVPGVHFSIVGRNPVPAVQVLASDRVAVTGSVPDVRPYLEAADVFVCPMRRGAGIKNKILQAWAMGKAVVSTPEGAAGLDARDGVNMIIRQDAGEFASAVAGLLLDPAARQRLGAAGRQAAVAGYSWASKADEMDALLQAVARGQKRP